VRRTTAHGRYIDGVGDVDTFAKILKTSPSEFAEGLTIYSDAVGPMAAFLLRAGLVASSGVAYTQSGVSSVRRGRVIVRDFRKWGDSPEDAIDNADHVEAVLGRGRLKGTPGAVAEDMVLRSLLYRPASDASYLATSGAIHGGICFAHRGTVSAWHHLPEAEQGHEWPDKGGTDRYPYVYDVDQRSAYPQFMLGDLPIEGTEQVDTSAVGVRLAMRGHGYLQGTLETGSSPLPALADGRMRFVRGVIRGTFSAVLVRRCLEHGGRIVSVSNCIRYAAAPYLQRVVSYLLELREKTGRRIWKAIANNIYGRLAGFALSYSIVPTELESGTSTIWSTPLLKCVIDAPKYRGALCSPASATWISSSTAVRSLDMIDGARQAGAVVPYWDTDGGIVCSRSEYVDPPGIAVKAERIAGAEILGKKTYRITRLDGTVKTVVAGIGQAERDVYFDSGSCIVERNQSLQEALISKSDPFERKSEVIHGRYRGIKHV
jgi:hypothetical protein